SSSDEQDDGGRDSDSSSSAAKPSGGQGAATGKSQPGPRGRRKGREPGAPHTYADAPAADGAEIIVEDSLDEHEQDGGFFGHSEGAWVEEDDDPEVGGHGADGAPPPDEDGYSPDDEKGQERGSFESRQSDDQPPSLTKEDLEAVLLRERLEQEGFEKDPSQRVSSGSSNGRESWRSSFGPRDRPRASNQGARDDESSISIDDEEPEYPMLDDAASGGDDAAGPHGRRGLVAANSDHSEHLSGGLSYHFPSSQTEGGSYGFQRSPPRSGGRPAEHHGELYSGRARPPPGRVEQYKQEASRTFEDRERSRMTWRGPRPVRGKEMDEVARWEEKPRVLKYLFTDSEAEFATALSRAGMGPKDSFIPQLLVQSKAVRTCYEDTAESEERFLAEFKLF
ncbi:unnamed protein product, partial [Amoebophrya sp. A120]